MITIDLQDADIAHALGELEKVTSDLTPTLKLIGRKLVESTEQRFIDRRDPEGKPWLGNSDLTIARKGFDHPLVGGNQDGDTGMRTQMLQHMNHAQVAENVLLVGNSMEYSAMQQFGGTKADFPHLWGDIPARPFIGLSDADREMVVEQITDAVERAVSKRTGGK